MLWLLRILGAVLITVVSIIVLCYFLLLLECRTRKIFHLGNTIIISQKISKLHQNSEVTNFVVLSTCEVNACNKNCTVFIPTNVTAIEDYAFAGYHFEAAQELPLKHLYFCHYRMYHVLVSSDTHHGFEYRKWCLHRYIYSEMLWPLSLVSLDYCSFRVQKFIDSGLTYLGVEYRRLCILLYTHHIVIMVFSSV